MKKTMITALAALALAASAAADALTYTITPTSSGKATVHGFQLTLTSSVLEAAEGSPTSTTLSGDYTLNSLTLTGRSDTTGANVTYGLFVFSGNTNTLVGFSTGTATSGNGVNPSFSFTAADGSSPLTLNASTTYRFLAVSSAALEYANTNAASAATLTYSVGTGSASYSFTTDEATGAVSGTISGGLLAPGVRVDTSATDALCNAITGSNGTTTANYAIALTELSITAVPSSPSQSVPEPATAALSLLALAGLAARRRRQA